MPGFLVSIKNSGRHLGVLWRPEYHTEMLHSVLFIIHYIIQDKRELSGKVIGA